MVLVRKTELACRQGWDNDLWEPREKAAAGTKPTAVDGRRRPPARKNPSSSHDRSAAGSELEADRVVDMGIGSDVPQRSSDAAELTETPAPFTRPEAPNAGHRNGADSDYKSLWSSRPQSDNQGEDHLQNETISPRFGSRREEWDEPEAPPLKPSVFPIPVDVDLNRSPESMPALNGQRVFGTVPQASLPVPEPDARRRSSSGPAPGVVRQSGATEQFEPPSAPESAPSPDERAPGDSRTMSASPDIDQDESENYEPVSLPMLNNEKACCRNCRDFLPAKDGVTGWCNNPFAFEERHKVSGAIVACQSSFGSWWSPADDWWMERADIAHHSAPTPLFDHLIRQLRNRYYGHEGSTEGQERS